MGTDGALSGNEIFAAAAEVFPDTGRVVQEVPSAMAAQQTRLPTRRPNSFFFTTSGGLGFGLPAAVGIALADPSRTVAAIGDGSMQYAIQALATAAAHEALVTVLVMDNGENGILKSFAARENTPKVPGLDLPPVDFLSLAASYGVPAEAVETADELRKALERGFAGAGPPLVRVPLALEASPA